jgi:hypothetical protein
MNTKAKANRATASKKQHRALRGKDVSDREVAAYWDTHSVADEWDKLEPVEFSARPPARKIVTLRLDPGASDALRSLAHRKGTNYSTLVRQWVSERLRRELGGEFKKAHV